MIITIIRMDMFDLFLARYTSIETRPYIFNVSVRHGSGMS